MVVDRQRIYHKRGRLRQLRAFCRVVQTGSIARAADSLDLAPASVSSHLRELEHELDTYLFERSSRGLTLNSAGERLYNLAEPVARDMDRVSGSFVRELGDVLLRRIHFGASQAAIAHLVPAYLQRFQALYPDMRVRVHTCLVSEGVERMLEGELDFVLGPKQPSLRTHPSIVYHHVANYDIVLITAPDHPLAGRKSVAPAEIAACPLIAPKQDLYTESTRQVVAQRFGFDAGATIEVSRWGVIKRYVEQGLGVSLVPSLCLSEKDALATIPLVDYFPTESYGVFTRRGRFLTTATTRLIQLMAPVYSI